MIAIGGGGMVPFWVNFGSDLERGLSRPPSIKKSLDTLCILEIYPWAVFNSLVRFEILQKH